MSVDALDLPPPPPVRDRRALIAFTADQYRDLKALAESRSEPLATVIWKLTTAAMRREIPWEKDSGKAPVGVWLIGWIHDARPSHVGDPEGDPGFWSPVMMQASIRRWVWRWDKIPLPTGVSVVAWTRPPNAPEDAAMRREMAPKEKP